MVVLDRTYVIYKMLIKTFKFFFCLVIMLCSACSSSDNPVDQEQEEDKYFFRYEVTCVSDSAQSIKKLYVITDNGNIITQMPEGKKTEWNATYGPVSKKCYIGLSCNDEDEKINTKFHVRILVKKNDEPFVLKKEDSGSDVTLMYIINPHISR